MPAKFIVIDGPDGSGTTKQTSLLVERLNAEGFSAVQTMEPTESDIGKLTRKLIESDHMPHPQTIQLLFSTDRSEHVHTEVLPALGAGKHVVCDRYALSTLVYGQAAGLDTHWLADVNAQFPKPDLTILTLPPFEVCQERLSRRDTHDNFEESGFQKTVYELYQGMSGSDIEHVDTSGPIEQSAEQIWQLVAPIVRN